MNSLHPIIHQEAEALARKYPRALITVIDPAGLFQYVSPSATELVSFAPAEALGRPFADFTHPEDVEHTFLAVQDALLNDQSVEISLRARTKSGDYRVIRGHCWKRVNPETGEIFLISRADAMPN